MTFTIEHEREEDGRRLAEAPELLGVLAYGATAGEAMAKAEVPALRVPAGRIERNEDRPQPISVGFAEHWDREFKFRGPEGGGATPTILVTIAQY